jgi:hypothetical protein
VVADAVEADGCQEWYDDWAVYEAWLKERGLPAIPEEFKTKRKQEKEYYRQQVQALVPSWPLLEDGRDTWQC